MARGFLRGALWGGAASLCAAGIVSVIAEGPMSPVVSASAPTVNEAPHPSSADAAKTQGDRVPVTGQHAPKAPAPEPDTLTALGTETLDTAALPETGSVAGMPDPGVEAGQGGINTGATQTPVVGSNQTLGLTAPAAEPGVRLTTDPAQPAVPDSADALALTEDPVQPASPYVTPQPTAPGDTAVPDLADTSISVDPVQPPVPDVPSETQAFEPLTQRSAEIAEGAPAPTPRMVPDARAPQTAQQEAPSVSPATRATPAPRQSLPEDIEAAPDIASLDELEGIGAPAGTVGNLAPDVQINRLPSLRDVPVGRVGEASPEPDGTSVDIAASDRPVSRYAVPYDNSDSKPVMAIVLMDEGVDLSRATIGLPALRSFPYPISFAVDSSLPDAKQRMAAYRGEGFEVLAMIDLPQGAKANDAEVSLAVALDAVPEAVGVLEGVKEGVQGSRDVAQQVTEILAQTGHGFVTQNNGLNTVQKLAAKAGVPSAVVFRDFDSKGQTPTVIRRFLDQAAFRAGRDGTVIMLGRLREDTVSALLLWGLQGRSTTVALVPVSAALKTQ